MRLKKLRNIQLKLIEDLKQKTFLEILQRSSFESLPLPSEFEACELTISTSKTERGTVVVEIRSTDRSDPAVVPSWLVNDETNINIGQRVSIDGFEMSVDGEITPMYGDDYDDEDE